MELDITKVNYLHISLIEQYYDLVEIISIYNHLGMFNKERKRDIYEVMFDKFQPFSNIEEVKNNINILNNTVFLHKKKLKKIPNSLPEEKIKKLNPDGFNLLGLNLPFNKHDLKKAYEHAIEKYHPDVGGNENDMKKVNNAYLIYREFLFFENYIKRNEKKSGYFEIIDGKGFYRNMYSDFISILIDSWKVEEAYELLIYLLDFELQDFDFCNDSNFYAWRIKRDMSMLIDKLTVINKYDILKDVIERQPVCKGGQFKRSKNDLKKILDGKVKHRFNIIHPIQAKYAFKNNAITEKRYLSAMKRFAENGKDKILSIKEISNLYAPEMDMVEDQKYEMTPVEIINELKDIYSTNEHIDEMMNELKDMSNFNYWGEKLCSYEFGKNLTLAGELFNQSIEWEKYTKNGLLLKTIENIASSDVFNDKEWAKVLCLEVQNELFEDEYVNEEDLVLLSKLITNEKYINDKKWGKEVIQKSLEKTNDADLLIHIADIIASSDGLNDKKWAREICLSAQKNADWLEYLFLGDLVAKKDGLDDKDWSRDNYLLAANGCESQGCFNMIAEHVINSLNDIELANKIKNMTPKKVETTIVKFTIYGGVDDKGFSIELKNIIEDNTYYELEVSSGEKIKDVLRNILNNKTFIKEVVYEKWEKIFKPNPDADGGEEEGALYINELIYEGKTYDKDYQANEDDETLSFTSRMYFYMDEQTMMCPYV